MNQNSNIILKSTFTNSIMQIDKEVNKTKQNLTNNKIFAILY